VHQISSESQGDGWVAGNIGDFQFDAKVYDIGSQHGIKNGRVSKLTIWNPKIGNRVTGCIANYDRGWDMEPANIEQQALLEAVLKYLEELPPVGH